MGLFNFFKKDKEDSKPENGKNMANTDAERFEKEVRAVIPRYLSVPQKEPIQFDLTDPATNKPIAFDQFYARQFEHWKTVRSRADRRGIIYSILDSVIGSQLELWQIINRFTDDRYAQRALEIASQNAKEKDFENPLYWTALARTNFVLIRYAEAESNALKALEIDPDLHQAKIILGDIYHFTHKEEKAHELYNEVLKDKLPKGEDLGLDLTTFLGFDGDMMFSPIYASAWLKEDKNVTEDLWNWAGEEYYYSPHFRAQHAYHLIAQKDMMKGFVKLLTLANEMPWYKEAVLNSYKLIDQLGMGDDFATEQEKLKALIDANQWKDEDLHSFKI